MSGRGERGDRKPAAALDALIAEAKLHDPTPALDWDRLEERIVASAATDQSGARPIPLPLPPVVTEPRRSIRGLPVAGVILAAAALAVLYLRPETAPSASVAVKGSGALASAVRSVEGEARINAAPAVAGSLLHAGDHVDTPARAFFERTGKVAWLLENGSAKVNAAAESLVLGLETGAIEAQVTPVPAGEAFAVDVATDRGVVRVAVHGTHLRVARAGARVTVDLTEGVVSIGVPPRTGMTFGTLVTAPAHVELDATDLASIRVDHLAAAVRPAVPLDPFGSLAARPAQENETPPLLAAPEAPMKGRPEPIAIAKGAVPRPTVDVAPPPKSEPPRVVLPPRDAIVAAVRDCATGRRRSTDAVNVTVTSSLRLKVSPAGEVESAQFSPPLLPEIQTCAATAIYKTKLTSDDESNTVTIPIEFSY